MVCNYLWAIGPSIRMAKKYRNFEFHSSLSSVLDFPCDAHKTKIYHYENFKSCFSAQASPDPHVVRKWRHLDRKYFLQFNMGKLFPVSFEISSWGGGHHYILVPTSLHNHIRPLNLVPLLLNHVHPRSGTNCPSKLSPHNHSRLSRAGLKLTISVSHLPRSRDSPRLRFVPYCSHELTVLDPGVFKLSLLLLLLLLLYPMLLQRLVCSKRFYALVYEIRGTASYLGLNFCALGA